MDINTQISLYNSLLDAKTNHYLTEIDPRTLPKFILPLKIHDQINVIWISTNQKRSSSLMFVLFNYVYVHLRHTSIKNYRVSLNWPALFFNIFCTSSCNFNVAILYFTTFFFLFCLAGLSKYFMGLGIN